MTDQVLRLGDLIDDHCPRCQLVLNHAVASMVGGHVVKVICQTCHSEHAFRHGKESKKKPPPKATLYDQVLAKVAPPPAKAPAGKPAGGRAEAPARRKMATPARYISRHKPKGK